MKTLPEPDIRRYVLDRLGGRRCTPADLLRDLARHLLLERDQAQTLLRELVAAGELAYRFEHGRTFIEPSFDRPVRVSDHIVLTPPDRLCDAGPRDAVIRIMPGAAFGAGRHPSTRLALKGLDFVLARDGRSLTGAGSRVLDIGTGSGVLIIAAVKLGIQSGLALDIDPCAVAEARSNVEKNGLSGRIAVSDRSAETVDGVYELVTANLRTPTLARLAPRFAQWTAPRGALVISGIRSEEYAELTGVFEPLAFDVCWRGGEQDWAGVALTKK